MPQLQSHRKIAFVGGASYLGGPQRGPEKGPDAIQSTQILSQLKAKLLDKQKAQPKASPPPYQDCYWKQTFYAKQTDQPIHGSLKALPDILDHAQKLSAALDECIQAGEFPIIVGGDHSVAIGAWSGIITSLQSEGKFGLIWIDAHMDSHTPQTSHSKAIHGMPVATLLGQGDPSLTKLGSVHPKLNPKNLVLIGVRSYEEEEAQLLKSLGVRVYFIDEVLKRGFQTVFKEATQIVTRGTQGFGVSIDLDGFDPTDAPGVNTPSEHGIRREEALPVLADLTSHPQFKALEISELNPVLDNETGTTVQLAVDLILSIF